MADSIDDEAVDRVDQNIDPTALTQREIEEALPSGDDGFSREAKSAFADRVADQRKAVQDSVDLEKRITTNPANGQPQLRGPDGGFGPAADKVEGTRLQTNGDYVAELDDGSTFKIDTVDLNAGSSETRQGNW